MLLFLYNVSGQACVGQPLKMSVYGKRHVMPTHKRIIRGVGAGPASFGLTIIFTLIFVVFLQGYAGSFTLIFYQKALHTASKVKG